MQSHTGEITTLLSAVRQGEVQATDRLFERIYDELRRLAQSYVVKDANLTISATGLVHEAYLKLMDASDWNDRAHFMAVAARAMRQILTDRARARQADKRGGKEKAITLEFDLIGAEISGSEPDGFEQVLALDGALKRLTARNEQLGQLVELRFFGGLEVAEVAEVLDISERTAARRWARAKAHLLSDLAA